MRLFLSSLCLLIISSFCFAQEADNESLNKISFSMSLGNVVGVPSKYRGGSIPEIIGYNTQHQGGGLFSLGIGYQSYKWAFELNYEYAFYRLEGQNPFLFIPGKEYSFENKFPGYSVVDIYNNPLGYKYGQNTFLLSIGYKIRWKSLFLKPTVGLGVTSFVLPEDKVFMKDLGSNYSQEVSYKGREAYKPNYRIGFTLDYHLVSIFHIFAKYEYSYSIPLIQYKLSIQPVTGEKQEQIEGGRKALNMNNFSLGVAVELSVFSKETHL